MIMPLTGALFALDVAEEAAGQMADGLPRGLSYLPVKS